MRPRISYILTDAHQLKYGCKCISYIRLLLYSCKEDVVYIKSELTISRVELDSLQVYKKSIDPEEQEIESIYQW